MRVEGKYMVKFKENDIYALEIKNNKSKYNGRYIIIIKCSVLGWEKYKNKKNFRFKITKDKRLPKLEEINDLEYIITHFQHELNKYFPGEGIPFEELKAKRDKVKVYPDKYGYLYTCLTEIYFYNKNIPDDLIYIGNKEIDPPLHEYIPFTEYGYKYQVNSWDNIANNLISKYEDFNLKKSEWYNEEAAERVKNGRIDDIKARIECDRFVKKLEDAGILHKLFEGEERIEDSLTYVGGEDKDPYEHD